MIKSHAITFITLVVAAISISIPEYHEGTFPTGQITLKADTGKYLARCHNCGPAKYRNSASIQESNPEWHTAIWRIENIGDKIAFKADTGKYLARCHKCWKDEGFEDSVFVHVSNTEGHPEALWTAQQQSNGKWAFKADSGKYLARCNGCNRAQSIYTSFAFVQIDSPNFNPWAQWTVAQATGKFVTAKFQNVTYNQ